MDQKRFDELKGYFTDGGLLARKSIWKWTDDELIKQVRVSVLVLAYLKAAEEKGLVVDGMVNRIDCLIQMANLRGLNVTI